MRQSATERRASVVVTKGQGRCHAVAAERRGGITSLSRKAAFVLECLKRPVGGAVHAALISQRRRDDGRVAAR